MFSSFYGLNLLESANKTIIVQSRFFQIYLLCDAEKFMKVGAKQLLFCSFLPIAREE